MKWIGRTFRWVWEHLGNLVLLGAWLMSFVLPAWAVSAADVMTRYQPFSWVAAGFLGMLSFGLFMFLAANAHKIFVNARIRAAFFREKDRPNPLDKVFTRQRLHVSDLVPPLLGAIEEKTFIDCDLVGPAVIFLSESGPGALTLKGSQFFGCDAVIIADDALPQNATVFLDCTFSGCRFYSATLLFRLKSVSFVNQLINNLHWISPTPTALAAQSLFRTDEAVSDGDEPSSEA